MHPSPLRKNIATTLALGFAVTAVASTAFAQRNINFTIPADAPNGGFGTVGVLEVTGLTGPVNNQDDARNTLLGNLGGTRKTGSYNLLNVVEDGGGGHFGGDSALLSGNGKDNFAVIYRGTVRVPTAGVYTFGVSSDDGFTLAFDNGTSPFSSVFNSDAANPGALANYNGTTNGALEFFGGRGTADTLGQITLSAGDHPFVMTYHDGCCGAAVELFAAQGAQTAFNNNFQLVGKQAQTFQRKLNGVGTWDYVRLNGTNGSVNGLDDAITRYNNNNPTGSFLRTTTQTINFTDPDPNGSNTGGHSPAATFPGDTPGVDDNDFGGAGRVTLTLGANDLGRYTFLVYSDDSTRFRIFGPNNNLVPILSIGGGATNTLADTNGDSVNDAFRTTGCCADAIGKWDLNTAGVYTLEAINNEQGGGAGFFVYGAKGDFNEFNPAFQLVGENLNDTVTTPGGLALVPEPASMGMLLLGTAMLGMRRRRN